MGCAQADYTAGRGQALKGDQNGRVEKYHLLPIAVYLYFQSIEYEARFPQLIKLS